MSIESDFFKRSKIDESKLTPYGFKKIGNTYKYSKNIENDSFQIVILIDKFLNVEGKIYELALGEEYTNFRVERMAGEFARNIRNKFIDLLDDIRKKCTIPSPFLFEQSNRIAQKIEEKYQDLPIFEWDKFPGYTIFKNSTTNKWYGIIMNIDKSKLDKNCHGEVEIIDLKLEPNKIQELLKQDGFYQAYHMNKLNWITIILDDTIRDEYLMDLLSESYRYSTFKK